MQRGFPNIHAKVIGIYPWMTRKQWNQIWDENLLPYFNTYGTEKDYFEPQKRKISKKRHTFESLKKQMERDSEWYRMVEIENLPLPEG